MQDFFDEYKMKKKIYKLNLLGLKCPLPVLKISKIFKKINKGDIILVKTDDPKANLDIENLTKSVSIKILKKNYLDGNEIDFRLEKY